MNSIKKIIKGIAKSFSTNKFNRGIFNQLYKNENYESFDNEIETNNKKFIKQFKKYKKHSSQKFLNNNKNFDTNKFRRKIKDIDNAIIEIEKLLEPVNKEIKYFEKEIEENKENEIKEQRELKIKEMKKIYQTRYFIE